LAFIRLATAANDFSATRRVFEDCNLQSLQLYQKAVQTVALTLHRVTSVIPMADLFAQEQSMTANMMPK